MRRGGARLQMTYPVVGPVAALVSMLRDQIWYNEFCRRGQKQQKSGEACAGMPETPYGANSHQPID
jgi:hypothetical protein